MICLPMLFWCGNTLLARALIHTLAAGVFFTGVLKDLLCLPRPLSPPLQRISMSKSAALEYGFPSTHSANAVSVSLYGFLALNRPDSTLDPKLIMALQALVCVYAVSIIFGRLYCGMHGFFDVTVAGIVGAVLTLIQFYFVEYYNDWIHHDGIKAIVIIGLVIIVLVRVHPEPADDCPCFDDSVAFAGVIIGIETGNWHFAQTPYSWNVPAPATVPFDVHRLGWSIAIGRIFLGVACVIAWRAVAKKVMLKGLPPLFRIIEKLGLSLPRRFFTKASEYDHVPGQVKTDSLIPRASEIPSFLSALSHPLRARSVSIGPQSAADAYETLAVSQQKRRESLNNSDSSSKGLRPRTARSAQTAGYFEKPVQDSPSSLRVPQGPLAVPPSPALSTEGSSHSLVPQENPAFHAPLTPCDSSQSIFELERDSSQDRRDREEEKAVFSQLSKPRVRYDVEVITKLVVYTGIGFIAAEGAPFIFWQLGLGLDGSV